MSRAVLGVLLVGVWILLWGALTVGSVVSGVAVVIVLYLVFPSTRPLWPSNRFRPLAVARLIGYVARQIVVSNVLLAGQIVAPRARLRAAVMEVPMRIRSRSLLTLVSNLLAITPGTLTVAASAEPGILRLHVLLLHEPTTIASSVHHLEWLVVRALGTPADAVAIGRPPEPTGVDP